MEQIRLLLKITLFWWGFQRLVGAASESEKRGLGTSSRVRMGHVPSHGTRVIYLSLPGTTVPGGDSRKPYFLPCHKGSGAPSFALFAKGGMPLLFTRGASPKLLLIPPFAENAKDGAPDPLWQARNTRPCHSICPWFSSPRVSRRLMGTRLSLLVPAPVERVDRRRQSR